MCVQLAQNALAQGGPRNASSHSLCGDPLPDAPKRHRSPSTPPFFSHLILRPSLHLSSSTTTHAHPILASIHHGCPRYRSRTSSSSRCTSPISPRSHLPPSLGRRLDWRQRPQALRVRKGEPGNLLTPSFSSSTHRLLLQFAIPVRPLSSPFLTPLTILIPVHRTIIRLS